MGGGRSRGFEQTMIEQVAKAAGMSRAMFFHCFPTKEGRRTSGLPCAARVGPDTLDHR
ncbi:TetR/AcrR family transcriptional regulator [Streptomyces hokutonensis]|uniref:TetR/AcrR family transcriptional regulator n=1 Tax=Streptomyces hokutonensis TaxID=1306990 RepID=UPI0036BE9AAB